MKYFEKTSFTKKEKKDLLMGAASGVGISAGVVGIETQFHRTPYKPFKKYWGIAKKRKIPIAAIIGGSALLKAGIEKIKKEKKEKQALRNIVDAHPNLNISFKGHNK